jgi:hypothetical protein
MPSAGVRFRLTASAAGRRVKVTAAGTADVVTTAAAIHLTELGKAETTRKTAMTAPIVPAPVSAVRVAMSRRVTVRLTRTTCYVRLRPP